MAEDEVPAGLRDAVAELLFQSQMLEWMMRVYLSEVNRLADEAFGAKGIRFKSGVKHFEKHTLGRLVDLFAAHTDDDGLVQRLRDFTKHRNDAAHNYFVAGWIHRESPDVIAGGLATIRDHVEEAKALVHVMTLASARVFEPKSGSAKRD